jgi:hypothetical protein
MDWKPEQEATEIRVTRLENCITKMENCMKRMENTVGIILAKLGGTMITDQNLSQGNVPHDLRSKTLEKSLLLAKTEELPKLKPVLWCKIPEKYGIHRKVKTFRPKNCIRKRRSSNWTRKSRNEKGLGQA